jgi:hypothetical protein
MKPTQLFCGFLLCCAIASPAFADVTMKSKASATGAMAAAMASDKVDYVKGAKMRTDQTTGAGKKMTTIIDASTRQLISIDHDKKEAQVMDMKGVADSMSRIGVENISVSITPAGTTRQVAGKTCEVYDMKIAVPIDMGKMKMTMVMSGPHCLVKNGPGQADFQAFYKASSEGGLLVDQAQAKSQPGVAKALADMHKKMSELGVPYASEMTIQMQGEGPMAEMMKKSGSIISTEVIEVSAAPLAASLFEVPEGYKVTKR